MDPKLRQQLFIRKHRSELFMIIGLAIILLPILFILQAPTQYKQQAAGREIPQNPTTAPAIKPDYKTFLNCFDKPDAPNSSCSPSEHKAADLNNDGIVNGTDYNLLIRK